MPHWVALDQLPDDPDRFGHKAIALARAAREGLPVLPGWVLPEEELPGSPAAAHGLADALLATAPDVARWILRSSSPLEDRPGRSAAGLFASPVAEGRDGIARALLGHERSRHDALRARRLGHDTPLPLAVLAQPAREFLAWCTAESRPAGLRLEGRPDPLPAALVELAHRAAPAPGVVLELGLDDDGPWLLQRRPAPAGAPAGPARTGGEVDDPLPPAPDGEFEPDLEHSPLPLCPLLATTFGPWLQAQGAAAGSWLVDGRWHDRVRGEARTASREEAGRQLRRWESTDAPALRARVAQLERELFAAPMDAAHWAAWNDRWLAAQALYFAAPRGAARRWAMAERGDEPLPATVATRRRAALARLAAAIDDPAAPAGAHERRPLGRFLARHGHHAALPWDGRAVAWWEDPRRLGPWLEAARRGAAPPPVAGPASLAGRVLAMAEDDDDLLARLYALWRLAALRAAGRLGLEPADRVFELCRDDLGALLSAAAPADCGPALARGQALAARWERAAAPGGAVTRGVGAAAGRASGPPECRRGALDGGPPPPGCVLVVPALSPPDAIALGGIVAVVCEGGDALGHAALLAREAGVPCVVRAAGARAALAGHPLVLVDGDRGEVRPTRA